MVRDNADHIHIQTESNLCPYVEVWKSTEWCEPVSYGCSHLLFYETIIYQKKHFFKLISMALWCEYNNELGLFVSISC